MSIIGLASIIGLVSIIGLASIIIRVLEKMAKNGKKTKKDTKKGENRHQLLRIGLKCGFGFNKMVKSVQIGPEMVFW